MAHRARRLLPFPICHQGIACCLCSPRPLLRDIDGLTHRLRALASTVGRAVVRDYKSSDGGGVR